MKALQNSFSHSVPSDIVISYIKLYKKVGKSEHYLTDIEGEYELYRKLVAKDDVYYLFRTFFAESKISDTRLYSIIEKKGGSVPKNNDEIIARNLMNIFNMIYSGQEFSLMTNELASLSDAIFQGVNKNYSGFKKSTDANLTYRKKLDSIIDLYSELKKEKQVEFGYLNLCFLVDFLKLSPFKEKNDLIGIITYYVLSLTSDIKSFAYVSFFKKFSENYQEYEKALNEAFYNYDDGYPRLSPLLNIMIKIADDSYTELENIHRDYVFDKGVNKSSSVENIVYKLDELFSKEDIRRRLPGVSTSTIDRTLKSMQNEGKISAYGRGRNAKWLRIDRSLDEKKRFMETFRD